MRFRRSCADALRHDYDGRMRCLRSLQAFPVVLGLVLLCTSCTVTPADPGRAALARPAPLQPEAWPERVRIDDTSHGPTEPGALSLVATPETTFDLGGVTVSQRKLWGRGGEGYLLQYDMETTLEAAGDAVDDDSREALEKMDVIAFVSYKIVNEGEPYFITTPEGETRPIYVRSSRQTNLFLHIPKDRAARGTVAFLGSATPFSAPERNLIDRLVEEGWAVIYSLYPSGRSLDEEERLLPGMKPTEVGRRVARALDDRTAEWVYSFEGAMDYLRSERPDVPLQPLVAVGASLGTIALPALCARHHDRLSAAVFITGGLDVFDILSHTALAHVREQVARPLEIFDSEELDAAHAAYLETTMLDGVRTAAVLRDRPVLQLHAVFDAIVPARTGRALYEELGRPERWDYYTGHLGFFLLMALENGDIVDWINEASVVKPE